MTPTTKVRFEVFAERLGSPLDAALVVRNEPGADLARVEDGPGTLDPVLEYAVPDKVDDRRRRRRGRAGARRAAAASIG